MESVPDVTAHVRNAISYTAQFCLNQSKKVKLGKFHVKRVKLGDLMINNTGEDVTNFQVLFKLAIFC